MMPFVFKSFTIEQSKCAMKIGTDAVLLGAWVSLKSNPQSILDIGTGTGILALQMAQRSDTKIIDAIEIESNAYEQAVENFENSPWNNRLFCYHTSLEDFSKENILNYDLIVSNPPFYKDNFQSKNKARNLARSTSSLPYEQLVYSVSKLLSKKGQFATIIPYKEEANFIILAEKYDLNICRICRVRGNKNSQLKRSILTFSNYKQKLEITDLIIENERHQYTTAYQNLVKDFYIKM